MPPTAKRLLAHLPETRDRPVALMLRWIKGGLHSQNVRRLGHPIFTFHCYVSSPHTYLYKGTTFPTSFLSQSDHMNTYPRKHTQSHHVPSPITYGYTQDQADGTWLALGVTSRLRSASLKNSIAVGVSSASSISNVAFATGVKRPLLAASRSARLVITSSLALAAAFRESAYVLNFTYSRNKYSDLRCQLFMALAKFAARGEYCSLRQLDFQSVRNRR